MTPPRAKKSTQPATTRARLQSVIKESRNIMRKDAGLNGDLDRPGLTWVLFGLMTAANVWWAAGYLIGFGRRWWFVAIEVAVSAVLLAPDRAHAAGLAAQDHPGEDRQHRQHQQWLFWLVELPYLPCQ